MLAVLGADRTEAGHGHDAGGNAVGGQNSACLEGDGNLEPEGQRITIGRALGVCQDMGAARVVVAGRCLHRARLERGSATG